MPSKPSLTYFNTSHTLLAVFFFDDHASTFFILLGQYVVENCADPRSFDHTIFFGFTPLPKKSSEESEKEQYDLEAALQSEKICSAKDDTQWAAGT